MPELTYFLAGFALAILIWVGVEMRFERWRRRLYQTDQTAYVGASRDVAGRRIILPKGGSGTAPPSSISAIQEMRRGIEAQIEAAKAAKAAGRPA